MASIGLERPGDSLRRGNGDHLPSPLSDRAARDLEMRSANALREELRDVGRFGPLIGASAPMQAVYDLIGRVACTGAGVLISGETGTGKEIVAQTIHSLSHRSHEAFLPLNCGALSSTLIESELFGHERGSFTGADRLHRGYFERADRGTLFLDEISEMPSELQVRLLRALEASAVSRVGGVQSIKVDVRIIAATNLEPGQAVAAGRLRQDLLYRLNVFPIGLPPLRDRGDDVLLLAEEFLRELNLAEGSAKTFTPACLEQLRRQTWPGNVRQLRNVVHRAFILAEDELGVADLLLPRREGIVTDAWRVTHELGASNLVTRLGTSLASAERGLILATLEHCHGDKKSAAEVLGLSVKTIYNRLREYKAG
jgi:DNA-binding NtrC family response regulator